MLNRAPHHNLLKLFNAAVDAALPNNTLEKYLEKDLTQATINGNIIIIAFGKAGASMTIACENYLDQITPSSSKIFGITVVPHGNHSSTKYTRVINASHPTPDLSSVNAANEALQLARDATSLDTVLFLISGGGSSLLCSPIHGLSLQQKFDINRQLLNCGATIQEMNTVRKAFSSIKGGKLAQAFNHARCLTYAISDIPGDDLSYIASGPTFDHTVSSQVISEISTKYQLNLPLNFVRETSVNTRHQQHRVIASSMQSLTSAKNLAESFGYHTVVLGDDFQDESKTLAFKHSQLIENIINGSDELSLPCVLLSGGESCVILHKPKISNAPSKDKEKEENVKETSRGGRNTEYLLALFNCLEGQSLELHKISALACDTDGIDGSQRNAGAYFTNKTFSLAKRLNLNSLDYLKKHNSFSFFQELNHLIYSGDTQTNVNDFRIIVIEKSQN